MERAGETANGRERARMEGVFFNREIRERSSKVRADACTEPSRPPRRHKLTVQPLKGRRREPHTRHCNANPAHSAIYPPLRVLPQSGADIPVCARRQRMKRAQNATEGATTLPGGTVRFPCSWQTGAEYGGMYLNLQTQDIKHRIWTHQRAAHE